MTGAPPVTFRVAGVSFRPGYPGNLWDLRDTIEDRKAEFVRDGSTQEQIPVVLVRDPGNQYDPNAIEVHVPSLVPSRSEAARGFIGFVPKELAARWAPRLDAGGRVAAHLSAVYVDDQHEDRPGCEVQAWLMEGGRGGR